MAQRNAGLVPITEISTERVPRARRVELWESYNASSLVGIRCSDFSKRGLRARARIFDLGAVRIMEMRGNEHVVERTGVMANACPKKSIFTCLLLEGEGFFFQSGKCVPVVPGDVVTFFSDIPHLYGWTRESSQVIVETDAGSLPDCRPADCLQSALKLDSRLRSGRFLASALRSTAVRFADHPSAAEAPQVAARTRSLLGTMLGFSASYREGADTAAWQLLRAETLIAEHLADPDLTALSVAHALRISVRHLNRLFATRNTTVSEWIWSQRLARAREELGTSYGRSVPVAQVAFRWGFVNQGHFARRFKEEFGVTPTQHRQQPLAAS